MKGLNALTSKLDNFPLITVVSATSFHDLKTGYWALTEKQGRKM
jgi:hypothetical protein